MKKPTQNRMTLEKLARMMARGFNGLEERVGRLEYGMGEIQLKLDYLAPKFEVDNLKRRVSKIEQKLNIT